MVTGSGCVYSQQQASTQIHGRRTSREVLMATQPLQTHHRSQLPSWNRPGLGARASGTKTLSRDMISSRQEGAPLGARAKGPHDGIQRVLQLEKSLRFLTEQHLDTLKQLHGEAERLKRENRELNFRMIMCRCGQTGRPRADTNTPGVKSRRGRRAGLQLSLSREESEPTTPSEEIQVIFLEEKLREMKKALSLERSKNAWLLRVIEQKLTSADHSDSESGSPAHCAPPLLAGGKPGASRTHPPTLQACETIIKRLQNKNSQQNHELSQLKADLRDVLYSHKWTPDAYLMARAYVPGEEGKEEWEATGRVAAQTSKETVDRAYQRVREGVVLPALVPRLPTNMVADRQRRSHALRGGGAGVRIVGRERTSLQ